MGARLMVSMVFSMTDTRGDHRPIYQYDAEQQGPDECRSSHFSLTYKCSFIEAPPPLLALPFEYVRRYRG
jgi:hypothetical protein